MGEVWKNLRDFLLYFQCLAIPEKKQTGGVEEILFGKKTYKF